MGSPTHDSTTSDSEKMKHEDCELIRLLWNASMAHRGGADQLP
jgi:hypothetical protein